MSRIAIIGAGIKGAALAALLSGADDVSVVLLEAGDGPTGATVTNHGRLHAGTAGFSADSVELMARRHRGSQLWRSMGVGGGSRPGLYLFDEAPTYQAFADVVTAAGIPTRPAAAVPFGWATEPYAAVEVLEYGFNPAAVTQDLTAVATAGGVERRFGTTVTAVGGSTDAVTVHTGATADRFDVVVNCTARWSAALPMTWRDEPLFELDWFIWQIMVAAAKELLPLEQVVVRARPSGEHASVVPHRDYVTLDFKSQAWPEPASQAPGPRPRLRPVERGDGYLETCISAFPPLADARDVLAFEGIQGRVRGAKPGSVNTLFSDPAVPGYLVAQGGQASTALLDAVDVLDHLWACRYLDDDPYLLLGRLIRTDAGTSRSRESLMAWEAVPDDGVRELEG